MKLFLIILSAISIYRLGEDADVQPAHVAMPLLTVWLIYFLYRRSIEARIDLKSSIIAFCFLLFGLRNIFDALIYQSSSVLLSAIYWPLASLFFLLMIAVVRQDEWIYFVKCLSLMLMISAAAAFIQAIRDFPTRASGLSGTENHLAIQIVHLSLMASALRIHAVGHSLTNFFGLSSFSRAYYLFFTLNLLVRAKKNVALLLAFVMAAILIVLATINLNLAFNNIDAELESFFASRFGIGDVPSDSGGRGYWRTILHPEYFLFGASERVREFYGDPFLGQIHSNFISLAFCFGVPGIVFSFLFCERLFTSVGAAKGFIFLAFSMALYFYSNIIFLLLLCVLFGRSQTRSATA